MGKDRSGAHAKEVAASTQSVAAKIVITRRKIEKKRLRMVDPNKYQAEVTAAARAIVTDSARCRWANHQAIAS